MTISPSSPVNRSMVKPAESAHHFENEGAVFRGRRGDAERVFHQLRGLFYAILAGIIEAAPHAARVALLAALYLENDADCRIDGVLAILPSCADHGRSHADALGIDG